MSSAMRNSTFGLRAGLEISACSTPGSDAAAAAPATVPKKSRRVQCAGAAEGGACLI
jgi:uncharacterized protein YgiB involved in biofilm formation